MFWICILNWIFGLECISRGAKKVTFIESDNVATTVLRNNLNLLLYQKHGH